MAFLPVNLTLWSNAQSPNTPPTLPQWWGYLTVDDNVAAVSASGYFNINPNTLLQNTTFRVGDFIYAVCTDAVVQLQINAITPNITTVLPPADIAPGTITTAMLGNNIVTAAKIANATITTTQIAAAANIALTQLAALPSADIIVGSAGNVATAVAMSGDVAISNTGATTIQAGAVTGSKMANNTVATAQLDQTTIQYVKVPMTAAQWNAMYGAPFLLVAAPAAGKQIVVQRAVLAMTFVSAQYAAGGAVALQYDSTVHGAGPLASATLAAATVNAYAASSDAGLAGADTSGASSAKTAKGLYISNDTAAFTTGDGTWNVHVWYEVVTL